jgi:hypothetical protein
LHAVRNPTKTLFLPNPFIQGQRRNTPIRWQNTLFYITMDATKPPIRSFSDKSVFDRIEMNVINMPSKISFITNLMLPKASLPNSLLVFVLATS